MERMRIGSLFDGSGTAPLAATMLGWEPVWASEIEPFPVAVTRARFPDTKHLGNITEIDGAEIEPVDVIVGGSPCQDLSVAGKQAGLDGERSNLFYEMTRIIREMREVTNGAHPRFVVWENVVGAFSSNKGRDFLAVVEAFCALADDAVSIPEPEKDRKTDRLAWRNAGAVVGDGWSFAWRVLDAQYWGVPQRRRRIFAVLDFGSERAGEILFERTSVPWDSEPSGEAGEGTTADVVGRADRGGRVGAFCAGAAPAAGNIGYSERVAPTLKAAQCAFPMPAIVYALQGNGIDRALTAGCNGAGWREGEMYTLNTIDRPAVVYPMGAVGALCARADSSPCIDRGQPFVAYGIDCRNGALNEEIMPTMQAKANGGQSLNYMPPVLMESAQANAAITKGVSPCLNASHEQPILVRGIFQNTGRVWWNEGDTAQTLRTPCGGDSTKANVIVEKRRRYIVRRLTPTECARLQGFPDWWTDGVPGSDTAKYKMWGNGMALPCMFAVASAIQSIETEAGNT
jgi:DNA (cytosine-5)-methyltransferase 1